MTDLYQHSVDDGARERIEAAQQSTRALLARDDLDPAVRDALTQWAAIGDEAAGLHTAVTDLHILYNTVVEHATGVEAELMRRNHEVGQFLAGMSHEFRTPLNAIIGYCELVLEIAHDDGLEHIAAEIRHVQRAGQHMLALTNDVLDLSKVEAGRLQLLPQAVDLGALLRDVTDEMRPLAANRGNALRVQLPDGLPRVHVDPTRLRQCVTNLVGNACKFTSDGEIVVQVSHRGPWLDVAVRDTGIGMSPAEQGRLFRAFAQANATTSREYGGTGLGLALSLQLVEAMGGTIEVESARGEGSVFTVRLPDDVLLAEPRP